MTRYTAIDYCTSQVSLQDKDRYLSALFAGEKQREGLFAIYAFNLEIAKTRESVSEPMLGEIRLQWWREAIDEIFAGTPRRHQVVDALSHAIQTYALPKDKFHQLIDARVFDIYDDPLESLEDLSTYTAATSQTVMELAAGCLSGAQALTKAEVKAIKHFGIAYGLAGTLRSFHFHTAQGLVFMPSDVLRESGATREAIVGRTWSQGIHTAMRCIAKEAEEQFKQGTAGARWVRPNLRPALLPAVNVMPSVQRVRRKTFNAFEQRADAPVYVGQMRMLWSQLTGRF